MRARATAFRVLRITAVSLAAVLLLAFTLIQFQQHLLRHRAERLLADFHAIRLNQTTWPEMKVLMRRWGKWGYASEPCSADACSYSIQLSAPVVASIWRVEERIPGNYFHWRMFLLLEHTGVHTSRFDIHFRVQNGRVVQSAVVYSTMSAWSADEFNYGAPVGFIAQSRRSLRDAMGGDQELGDHPDYKIGRPSGCDNCEIGYITYTPFASQADIDRFTAFRFDCITRIDACDSLTDLLPASAPWHLYDHEQASAPSWSISPHVCHESPRSLGREAASVLEVEILTSEIEPRSPDTSIAREVDSVRLISSLKGAPPKNQGSIFKVYPYVSEGKEDLHLSEHMQVGRRYLFVQNAVDPLSRVRIDWCGVLIDTPQIASEVKRGIVERGAEPDPDFRPQWW